MKTGTIFSGVTKGVSVAALTTAGATQLAAWSHAVTTTTVANLSWITAASAKIAAIGGAVLGPIAVGASSIFGAGGAFSGFLGSMFGAGFVSAFVVPLIAIGMAVVAYKFIADGAERGGELIDSMKAASAARKQQATEPQQTPTPAIPEAGKAQERSPPAKIPTTEQTARHPADDAMARGVSYRDNVLNKARNQQNRYHAHV